MNELSKTAAGRRATLAAWCLLACALLYRLWALNGDMMFDPVVYAQNAFNILQGTFTLATDSWFAHRWPVFLPVVPCYAVLGVGTWSSKLWPLTASMGQLVLIYALGRRLLGPGPALVALAIAAVAPLDVVYASVLNPDIVISAFMTASVAAWCFAHPGCAFGERTPVSRDREAPARAGPVLLSGASWAIAMSVREFAVLLAPFFLGWILWKRAPLKETLRVISWFAAGLACVFVPLAAIYLWQTGDIFYRLGVVSGRYGQGAMSEGTQFLYYPWLMLHPRHAITGLMPHVSVLALLFAIARPNRVRVLLLLWVSPIVLYLQFGSMSLDEYLPILKRDRFLMPLTAPCALLAASIVPEITRWLDRSRDARVQRSDPRRSRRPWVRPAIPVALALFALAGAVVVREQRADGRKRAEAFASVVQLTSAEPDLPVLFDHWRTGYRFSYFYRFEEGADFYRGGIDTDRTKHPGAFGDSRLGYLAWYPRAEDLPACYVVLDDTVLQEVRSGASITQTYRRGELPDYAYDVPASWVSRGRFHTFRVYQVGTE